MILHTPQYRYVFIGRLFLYLLGIYIIPKTYNLEGFVIIVMIFICCFIIIDFMNLFFSIYKTVYSIDIDNENGRIISSFHKEVNLTIQDITKIEVSNWLKLCTYFYIKVICAKRKISFYISPTEEKDNFRLFVDEIKKKNPKCEIDLTL